jgi:chromosome segregation ATPase
MTTSPPDDRLDRAERLILGLAQAGDRTQQQVDSNSQAIAQTQRQIDQTQRQIDLNSQAIEQLIQIQRQTFERSESQMDSIRASLERIDRIMDYLMRRDGDRPSEGGI